MRKIRADRRLAHPAKVEAQEAIGLAHGRGFVGLFVDQPAERDRLAERDVRLPAVQDDRQQLPQRSDTRPFVGEERFHERILRSRRSAPEDRHRHQLHIERRFAQQRRGHLRERDRGLRRARAQRIPVEDHREHRALALRKSGADRRQRGGKAQALRLLLQHEEARQVPVLEDIAERHLRIDVQRRDRFRRDPGAHDEVQQAAQRREEEVAEADEAARARRRTGRRVGHRRVEAGSADLVPILGAQAELVKFVLPRRKGIDLSIERGYSKAYA